LLICIPVALVLGDFRICWASGQGRGDIKDVQELRLTAPAPTFIEAGDSTVTDTPIRMGVPRGDVLIIWFR